MLDKILKGIFSMRAMAVSMLIFTVAIAKATFIESDYGTPASKIAVYNARWFEILLLHLTITLIVNIVRYKMYQRSKWPILLFHLSFIFMMVGAAITRYVGYEGQMRIGVGETTNIIYNATPHFSIRANDLVNQYTYDKPHWLSEGVENPFEFEFKLPDREDVKHEKVKVEYVSFKEGMIDSIVEDPVNGGDALELVIRGESRFVFKGQQAIVGGMNFSFERENPSMPGVEIKEVEGMLYIQSVSPFEMIDMTSLSVEDRQRNNIDPSLRQTIPADTIIPFYANTLYNIGDESIVLRGYRRGVSLQKVKSPDKDGGSSYLTVRLTSGDESRLVEIDGAANYIIQYEYFQFAGLNFEIGYGAMPIELPFSVKCRDFQLDTYPGSTMPSSYASEVTVIDEERGHTHDQRIFMNNVMDYRGYRFFQSSYFPDGSGTVLSVNYDWWGTFVSYVAYAMMTLGMFLSIINPKGRIRELNNLIKKSRENRAKMLKSIVLLIGLGLGGMSYAQDIDTNSATETNNYDASEEAHHNHDHNHNHDHDHDHDHNHAHQHSHSHTQAIERIEVNYLSVEDAKELDDLLVQDYDGRIIPYHTLADKLLRKIHRSDVYGDKNAVQTITSMHLYGPSGWNHKEIVFVSGKIREELGVGKHISINDMEDEQGVFKWMSEYEVSYGKSDGTKSEFDRELIKLGERYRIMKEILQFGYLRIVPLPEDDNGTWVWPFSSQLQGKDQKLNALAFNLLKNLFDVSQGDSEFKEAKQFLDPLKEHQWEELKKYEAKNLHHLRPLTHRHVNIEIAYNKLKIFDKIQSSYFLVGFVLLALFFIRTLLNPTLKSESIIRKISYPFIGILILVFIAHGVGLGMLWYISGHAPWSDGYEAVIFISWATVLAGLFFIKKNPAVIAVTALLSALMLFVTELNLLDPEITTLEPVLKSYWLMIHVAIITASYGFLGISAVLGIINLVLYIAKNNKNKKRLQMNIVELTSVSEIAMIVGLIMLSIGTFLGGVWANESWGRYWGWDPKETWALVSMLVYAIILHLRWIPAVSNRFLFNVLSMWGYSAILFTFFGVNFILVGLHSYAQGEGVTEWPTSVIVAIVLFGIFTAIASIKYIIDSRSVKKA